jgi:hypothetical protein
MSEEAAVRVKANIKVEQNRVPSFTIISYSLDLAQSVPSETDALNLSQFECTEAHHNLPRVVARASLNHNFLLGLRANVSASQ